MAALLAPGAASASVGTQCSGVSIGGQGSSAQKLAQELWDPAFNTSENKLACNGTQGSKGTPAIAKYNPSGSGAGLKSFGVGKVEHNYEASNAYVGTDEPPNPTQKTEIEANETTILPKTLATIPVLQIAVSVIAHLPEGCTATSTGSVGRLVLNNSTLEGIFRGTVKTWAEITDGGDKITAEKGKSCNTATPITKIVRLDGSGTTHIFKKYLFLINTAPFEATNVKGESTGTKTWGEMAEGPENTSWPTAAAVTRPGATGGGAVVAAVAATPGSIGYANLADARGNASFKPPLGGAKKPIFWIPIQNKSGTVTYADPASNKEAAVLAESNCAKTEYTNGEGVAFPPASVLESWSEVTTKTEELKYTICGLTYDLGFTSYSSYPGTSLGEATTANNFLRFEVESTKGGGQFLIKKHDYEPLVTTVLKEAQKGAALIGD